MNMAVLLITVGTVKLMWHIYTAIGEKKKLIFKWHAFSYRTDFKSSIMIMLVVAVPYKQKINFLVLYFYLMFCSDTNLTTLVNREELLKSLDILDIAKEHALYFCLIAIGAFTLGFTSIFCFTVSAERQIRVIRKLFFRSIMRQDMEWFDTHESSELSTRFSE